MKAKQKGFTLVELMICVVILVCLVIAIVSGYVALHFITKFW